MNCEGAGHSRRCVLLFTRAPRAEAAVKGLRGGEALFALSQGRVRAAVDALSGVELVLVPPAAQAGADFGGKLEAAFRDAVHRGYEEIVAVPGDVPEVTAQDLDSAFRGLSGSDVVLGPSSDGGVWLIGLRAEAVVLSDFFERIPWRTPHVLDALVAKAPEAALLAELVDIDRRADARRMRRGARAAFDAELEEALGILLGVSPSTRASGISFAALALLSLPPPSRAPPLRLLTF